MDGSVHEKERTALPAVPVLASIPYPVQKKEIPNGFSQDWPERSNAGAKEPWINNALNRQQDERLPQEAWHVAQQKQIRVLKDADRTSLAEVPVIQGNFLGEFLSNPAGKLVGNTFSDYLIPTIFGRLPAVFSGSQVNTPRFGPRTGRGFGSFAEIKANGNNEGGTPSVTNDTWEALRIRRRSTGESYYVRGHLINQHINGPGYDWQNLTPLTQTTNHNHSNKVEEPVKLAAYKQEVFYRVQAIYGRSPWQWPNQVTGLLTKSTIPGLLSLAPGPWQFYKAIFALRDAEQHIPAQLQCDWWTQDGSHFQQVITQVENSDSGFWVDVDGQQAYDLSKAETILSLIDTAVALSLKAALMPSIFSMLPDQAARAAIALLNARLRFSLKGFIEAFFHFAGGELAAWALLEKVNWDTDSFWTNFEVSTLLELLSKLTGIGNFPGLIGSILVPGTPISVNREERELLGSLSDEERALFQNIMMNEDLIGEREHPRTKKKPINYAE
jgi:hypothetical protein